MKHDLLSCIMYGFCLGFFWMTVLSRPRLFWTEPWSLKLSYYLDPFHKLVLAVFWAALSSELVPTFSEAESCFFCFFFSFTSVRVSVLCDKLIINQQRLLLVIVGGVVMTCGLEVWRKPYLAKESDNPLWPLDYSDNSFRQSLWPVAFDRMNRCKCWHRGVGL